MHGDTHATTDTQSRSLSSYSQYGLARVGTVASSVVAVRAPTSPTAERVRGVAMRLMVGGDKQRARCLAVVSPERGDGRSFLAANLAAVFAQSGRRTLLIDADLRSPVQHTLFRHQAGPGLVALLSQKTTGYVGHMVADVPGLHLITAGEVHTAGETVTLAGEQFGELLEELSHSVDQLVIDTPAGHHYPDAEAVAARAGAALLLVRRNVTRLSAARQLVDDIRRAGVHIAGTVVAQR